MRLAALIAAILTAAAAPALAQSLPGSDVNDRPDPGLLCHVGVYRLDDGGLIDVSPRTDPSLRWRRIDGSTGQMTVGPDGRWTSTLGWTDEVSGPQPQLGLCGEGHIQIGDMTGDRIEQTVIDTTFTGHGGVPLNGRLILPEGDGPVPIMVEVHGSEGASALDFNWFQRLAPASGVGVFVYAKRGSGGSGGEYTQDFDILAADAAAAVVEARRLAGDRAGRMGLHGGSQGGWVAPLAATLTPVDFVIVGYGMAVPVGHENRDETLRDLREAGWGPDVLETALPIIETVNHFVAVNGDEGFGAIDAIRARYSAEPWWNDLNGEFTGFVLRTDNATLEALRPALDVDFSFDYQPLPVLRSVTAPMLWIQARDDTEAPPEETRDVLIALAREGRPVTLLEYPDTDHGIILVQSTADGRRVETGHAPGYIQAVLDWAARGRLDGDYGTGVILASPASTGAPASE